MQRCREGIADHFAFFQITECGMEFFELVKVVEDSFHDLIDDLFRGSGWSDKGCTYTKGFDVICRYEDPKAKKGAKEIQGRLVERNDQVTIINMKGRMKKIKNDLVVFVKLPKAKKEKGVN